MPSHEISLVLINFDGKDDGKAYMAKKAKDIAAITLKEFKTPGLKFVGHVSGLAIHVTTSGAPSWILRAMVGGERRDMGLGSYPEVTLAQAKEFARVRREQIRNGIDPLAERRAARASLAQDKASSINFETAADKYIAAHEPKLRDGTGIVVWARHNLVPAAVSLPH